MKNLEGSRDLVDGEERMTDFEILDETIRPGVYIFGDKEIIRQICLECGCEHCEEDSPCTTKLVNYFGRPENWNRPTYYASRDLVDGE